MDFELSDDQKMIRETVREFAEKRIKPAAHELDEKEEFSEEITRGMGELGIFGIIVPEEYGGQGLDYASYVIAVEELARVDGSHAATVAAGVSLGIAPLLYFGTEEQKKKYLPALTRGEKLFAFGLTEPEAGSDSRGSKTRAEKKGNDWVINGSKIFITNGSADMNWGSIVQTVTDRREDGSPEFTCFILEKGTPGFTQKTMHKKLMWRASNTAELYFTDVKVPDSAMLGKRGAGSRQMLKTLDSGRLSIGAMGLGCAQGAYEAALSYAKQRHQFGKPLSRFQAISFKLANMALKIEHARTFLYKACWLRDTGKPFGTESAMAKLYCSEVAKEVADEAVQIHGGYGLMKEFDVERFYRDQRLLQIGEGTSEIQRLVISRAIGC
ncbi:MAG: acyl-CoA dehydrogenase [Elusimicrobia bacterium CG1_02_63_36]|nr:MAG: acyl-CoA dehydrogenase [Elusimicrobia bacterium CG1_02_63_36]PIP83625.1 MAG: acyl-CoA dehydrogenase [Elusimicrobia bacterium CG22_combo_CG10-13_8_21_14_all_63_91]PJA14451.1 MAG: acyl-CoA dehydrogenase [Elusimicrobia bacterium CG_4_10_14_0_2_um_filter_63_34]PJB27084.1 MAG: acyl-CoA dehydrogenase [Elusimicrobia bacterium CG_4_9_14_3_um_filter_62_55]